MIVFGVLALFLTASSTGNTVPEASHAHEKQKDIESTIQYKLTGKLYDGTEPLQWTTDLMNPETELFQKHHQDVLKKFDNILTSAQKEFGVPILNIEGVEFRPEENVANFHAPIQISTVELQKIVTPLKTIFDFVENKLSEMQFVQNSQSYPFAELRFKLTFWPKSDLSLIDEQVSVLKKQMCNDINRYLEIDDSSYICNFFSIIPNNERVTARVFLHITQSFLIWDYYLKDLSRIKQFLSVKFNGDTEKPSDWIMVYDEDTILWNTKLTISGAFLQNQDAVDWNDGILNMKIQYSSIVIDKVKQILVSLQEQVNKPILQFDQFQFVQNGAKTQLNVMLVYSMQKYEEAKQTRENLVNVIPKIVEGISLIGEVQLTHSLSSSRAIIPPDDIGCTIQFKFTGRLYDEITPLAWNKDFKDTGSPLFEKYHELVIKTFGVILTSAKEEFRVPILEIEKVEFHQQGDETTIFVPIQISTVEFQKIVKPLKTIFHLIENKINQIRLVTNIHSYTLAELRFKLTFRPKSDSSLLHQPNNAKGTDMCNDIKRYLEIDVSSCVCKDLSIEQDNGEVTAQVYIQITPSFLSMHYALKYPSNLKQFLSVKFNGDTEKPSDWIIVYDEDTILWNTKLTVSGTFYENQDAVDWNAELLDQQSELFTQYSSVVIDKVKQILVSHQEQVNKPILQFDQFQFVQNGAKTQLNVMLVYSMQKYEEAKQTRENLVNVIPKIVNESGLIGDVQLTHSLSSSRAIIPPDDIGCTIKYKFTGILREGSEPLEWTSDMSDLKTALFQKYYQLVIEQFDDISNLAQEEFKVPILKTEKVSFKRRLNAVELHVTIQISTVELGKITQPVAAIAKFIQDESSLIRLFHDVDSYALAELRFKLTFRPKSDSSLLHQPNNAKGTDMCNDIKRYLGSDSSDSYCWIASIEQDNGKVTAWANIGLKQSVAIFNDPFKDLSKIKEYLAVKFNGNTEVPSHWIIVYNEDTKSLSSSRAIIAPDDKPIADDSASKVEPEKTD